MAITHAVAHAKPQAHAPPSTMLKYLNDRLSIAYTRGGTFITAFYAVLDPVKKTLMYSRAGHNPPRLVRGNQVLSINGDGGLPLGILGQQVYEQATISLQPGDLLLLYTDGITEATSPPNGDGRRDMFGLERLDQLLLESKPTSAQQCIDQIKTAVAAFSGNGLPGDDQTLIAIRCL
jgi:sigma-B regulation protein RsbU (phosphoserine phosphatase)